jgi:hypothetical protein
VTRKGRMVMKFENLKKLQDGQFRRLTGVKQKTFAIMVEIIRQADETKKALGGRPNKLSIEERILMTLEYLREYRTYAHIGLSYGLSEGAAFQNIRFVENTLVKSKEFRLPGKKALLKSVYEFEVVLVDAVESPIERPKKNNANFIQGRKNDTP